MPALQVTCLTAPADAGTYPVVVMVNGQDSVSFWGYTYTYDRTPSKYRIAAACVPLTHERPITA